MKRLIMLLAIFGLVFTSQVLYGQTQYTGFANLAHELDDCTGTHRDTALHKIEYIVIPRLGMPDSIIFIIHDTVMYNSGFARLWIEYNSTATDTSIVSIKYDADSINFSFALHFSFSEHNPSVPITDPCRNHDDDEFFIGITRISTATAGIRMGDNQAFIKFFPNPTNGLINISALGNKATVIDNLGRIRMTQTLGASDTYEYRVLDVSGLSAGCYSLYLDNGRRRTLGKFIKY